MSIHNLQIHGTGVTVGEVVQEAVRCLPIASETTLGGVKKGEGVEIDEQGVLSVTSGGGGGGGDTPVLTGGSGTDSTPGQDVTITGGSDGAGGTQWAGSVNITGGADVSGGGGGSVVVKGGDDAVGGGTGGVQVIGGQGTANDVHGGNVAVAGGDATAGNGGLLSLRGGYAQGGDHDGGDITLLPGGASGTGRSGVILLGNLPYADPHIPNAIWSDAGTLKISAG